MRPLLTRKHVLSVVPLVLAPLLHLWLRPLDLLLSDAIQVPVYLFLQNTNCLRGTAWSSSSECFPKAFPTPSIIIALVAEVVGQLSDCPCPHYTQSRTQLSSRFHEGECHIKTTSFVAPWLSRPSCMARADVGSHQNLYYFCKGVYILKILMKTSTSTSECACNGPSVV